MNVYDEFYPVAVELLEEFGVVATVSGRRPAEAPTRAEKLNRVARVIADAQTLSGLSVVLDPETGDDAGRSDSKGTIISLIHLIEGDRLTLGETTYGVGRVTALAPQGKAIIYEAVIA